MVDRKTAEDIVSKYAEAWINKDPETVVKLFTPDAVYQEWAFDKPFIGHEQIKRYWQEKIVKEQSEIEFKLLNMFIEEDTVIVETETKFFINNASRKNHMIEVMILEIEDGKIKSLREYWANQEEK